jgi:hypothetical protein
VHGLPHHQVSSMCVELHRMEACCTQVVCLHERGYLPDYGGKCVALIDHVDCVGGLRTSNTTKAGLSYAGPVRRNGTPTSTSTKRRWVACNSSQLQPVRSRSSCRSALERLKLLTCFCCGVAGCAARHDCKRIPAAAGGQYMTEVHARRSYFSCRHTQASSQKLSYAAISTFMDNNVLPYVSSPPPSVDGNLQDKRRPTKAGTLAAPRKVKAKSTKLRAAPAAGDSSFDLADAAGDSGVDLADGDAAPAGVGGSEPAQLPELAQLPATPPSQAADSSRGRAALLALMAAAAKRKAGTDVAEVRAYHRPGRIYIDYKQYMNRCTQHCMHAFTSNQL